MHKKHSLPDGLANGGSTRWRPINVGLGGGGSLG
jgi:hypothetical protein